MIPPRAAPVELDDRLRDPRPALFQLRLDDATEERHRPSQRQRRVDAQPGPAVVDR